MMSGRLFDMPFAHIDIILFYTSWMTHARFFLISGGSISQTRYQLL